MIQDNGEGARRRGDAPGEITIERWRARHMPAAVEIEHEAADEGRGSNDGDCFHPVEVNICCLCTLWRRRHETREECVLSTQCLEGGRRTDLALDEAAKPQAHEPAAWPRSTPLNTGKKLTATIVAPDRAPTFPRPASFRIRRALSWRRA